ncbi:MAG: hypothetical protein AB7L90_11075 [Hyphomicrobiaceae bacterium]
MAVSALLLICLSAGARAEPSTIDQNAWLNYAIIVNTLDTPSHVSVTQRGTINGISSVQLTGRDDAQMWVKQNGYRNTSVIYQTGWNTISSVGQSGRNGFSGYTDLPTTYWARQIDEGYLSYFMTGGFSIATLTDSNHTWFSRFGRAR